ncbi:MAG: FAD:protein FMN transferase [Demequinaceae bacterium]|nr:FAD:protein FMN transferase [Demequinaceae bacterium]
MTTTVGTYRRTVHAMAMPFEVFLDGVTDADAAAPAVEAFHRDLLWANDVFSLWSPNSVLSRHVSGELTLDECPVEVRAVIDLCELFRERTGGAFDARKPDGSLDPTGVVKSWAVARAALHLDAVASDWMVGASGDVLTRGGVRDIGIANPRVKGSPQGTDVLDVVRLGPEFPALATSGGAQVVDHIWDPVTGEPARHFMQVSVVGTDFVECDAWATAICAGGLPTAGLAMAAGHEVLLIIGGRYDGTFAAQSSPGWPSVAR